MRCSREMAGCSRCRAARRVCVYKRHRQSQLSPPASTNTPEEHFDQSPCSNYLETPLQSRHSGDGEMMSGDMSLTGLGQTSDVFSTQEILPRHNHNYNDIRDSQFDGATTNLPDQQMWLPHEHDDQTWDLGAGLDDGLWIRHLSEYYN